MEDKVNIMENQEAFKTPNKILARMQIVHLGKILFNLAIIALLIMLSSVVSFTITLLYYLLLIAITIGTFGLIYGIYPDIAKWWSGGDKLMEMTTALAESWRYTIPIVLALSLASIICLCFDRLHPSKARIVMAVIIALLALMVLILKMMGGGAA